MGPRKWIHGLRLRLTIGLLALWPSAFCECACLLEVDVPALSLASRILQREGEDGIALLDSIFAVGLIDQSGANKVEGLRRGESGCDNLHQSHRFVTASS